MACGDSEMTRQWPAIFSDSVRDYISAKEIEKRVQ